MGALRRCSTCRVEKPISDYYLCRGRPLSECRVCWRARVKHRRLTDPKVRAYDRARAKTPERLERASRISRAWRSKNPEAYRAQNAVNNAIRDGKIVREPCQICAAVESVHAHHKDYSRPLDVVWLCARCHHRLHALFPQLEGANKRSGEGP